MVGPTIVYWILTLFLGIGIGLNAQVRVKHLQSAIACVVDMLLVGLLQRKMMPGLRTWYYNQMRPYGDNEEDTVF